MKYSIYKLEYLQILTFRFLTVSLHCQWGEDWRVKMARCLKEEKQKLFLQSKITRRNLLQIITKRKADTKRRFLSLFAFCFKGLLSFIIICWRREKKTSSNQYVWILSSYQDFHIFSYLKDKDISIFPLLKYSVSKPGHIWGCEIQLHSSSLFRERSEDSVSIHLSNHSWSFYQFACDWSLKLLECWYLKRVPFPKQ